MKYYSEEILKVIMTTEWLNAIKEHCINGEIINVRLCRNCEYFKRDHPTIDTNGDFGFCTYRTDFTVLDDEPINWYFTDINGFCNEDEIGENDVL